MQKTDTSSFSFPYVELKASKDSMTNKLNSPIFRVGDTGVSSKNLLHWKNSGLLLEERSTETGWTRFSFIQYVWLRVVIQLREFGIPIETIKTLKKNLIFPNDLLSIAKEHYTINEFRKETGFEDYPVKTLKIMIEDYTFYYVSQTFRRIIYECIEKRVNFILILFKNGDGYFFEDGKNKLFKRYTDDGTVIHKLTYVYKLPAIKYNSSEKDEYNDNGILAKESLQFQSHISISLTQIIKDYLMYNNHSLEINALPILNHEEAELLKQIKRNDIKRITIRYKNQKPSIIEIEENKSTVDLESRYTDHIMKHGYQTISYETENGKMVSFSRTTKTKLQ
jgi:DNA-binding transcriptional MerR regulator